MRLVEPAALVTALAAARSDAALDAAAEFLLANTSQRMAQSLREEAAERGTPRTAEAEAAMGAVVAAIRTLEERGEIVLVSPPEG
jgi:flagellar motor switch protein FliG